MTNVPSTLTRDKMEALARRHTVAVSTPTPGANFLKFDRGRWTTRAGDVAADQRFRVSESTIIVGDMAWPKAVGSRPVKRMRPWHHPEEPNAPRQTPQGDEFQPARGMILDGEHASLTYETTSLGGMEAVDNLLNAIAARAVAEGMAAAIVVLDTEHYISNKIDPSTGRAVGKVFKPLFRIVGWEAIGGNADVPAIEDKSAEPEPAIEAKSAEPEPATVAEAEVVAEAVEAAPASPPRRRTMAF